MDSCKKKNINHIITQIKVAGAQCPGKAWKTKLENRLEWTIQSLEK